MHDIFPEGDWSPGQPSSRAELWRYIDFTQFIWILENRKLWFSSVSKFFDKFEGAIPDEAVTELAENLPEEVEDPERIIARSYESLKYTTFANCWHQRDRETAAMWQLYDDRNKQVAIKTTVGDFQSALPDISTLTMGCVNYEDYKEGANFPVTRISPFFHKRPSFRHEREYRAILSEFQVVDGARLDERYVEKLDRETPSGRSVNANPEKLIREVVVSPIADNWLKSLLQDVVRRYGYDRIDVRWSKLKEDPF